MTSNHKKQVEPPSTAFTANYKHQQDPQYPYLLASSLSRSDSQFEQSRAMKMLGDWALEYDCLSEVLKYKYATYLPKIFKILITKYQQQQPIEYCLARFIVVFYTKWKDIATLMIQKLSQSDFYTLNLLWYTCHNLVQDVNVQKQRRFLQFLTTSFEKGLRYFEAETFLDARKILQIVYLMNIYGCQQQFGANSNDWSKKFSLFQNAAEGQSKLNLLIQIIKTKNVLVCNAESHEYWIQKVRTMLDIIEQRLGMMSQESAIDKNILDLFVWLLDCSQVKQIIFKEQGRYLKTILCGLKPNQSNPNHIFHLAKYKQISNILYELLFKSDSNTTQCRLMQILDKFISHSFSTLNQESNFLFLDCLSEQRIQLTAGTINDLIKMLGNNHIRRTLPVRVMTVLAKTLTASIDNCQLSDDMISLCMRSFSQTVALKCTDPLISNLRDAAGKLFLKLMTMFTWQDQSKNDVILSLCQETQRNEGEVDGVLIQMLYLVIKKFGFSNQTKIEPLLTSIFYKICKEPKQISTFLSLLVTASFHFTFPKAKTYIEEISLKNPSPYISYYSFQARKLIETSKNNNNNNPQSGFETVIQIFRSVKQWQESVIDVNLMMLELYFLKLKPEDALSRVQQIDQQLTAVIQSLYEEGNYRLLCLICAKVLPSVGGEPSDLQKLESYKWLRKMSFDMLARSFYKSTSVSVCYAFSQIVLRSERSFATLRWLSQQQFFDYLFQGLNDFLSKQKVFTLQIATSLLLLRLVKANAILLPPLSRLFQFQTLAKNETWWSQAGSVIHFCSFKNTQNINELILPQFKSYYQSQINLFFKDYFKAHEAKITKAKEKENAVEQDL